MTVACLGGSETQSGSGRLPAATQAIVIPNVDIRDTLLATGAVCEGDQTPVSGLIEFLSAMQVAQPVFDLSGKLQCPFRME